MNLFKSPFLSGTLLLLALFSIPSQAQEACVKRVFNSYCLGGAAPDGTPNEQKELLIEDSKGNITLHIAGARITAITREIKPANWLNFTDLKVKLVRLYSTATDVSDFPLYATSRSSKLNAIRAGRGFAAARWQQSDWAVQLEWRTLDSMQLRYELLTTNKDDNSIDTLEGL